jgi:hypothetical protein
MSVIKIPRLPDQLSINFGPSDAIANFVLATDRAVRDIGIRLSLSTDFSELQQVNGANRSDWYALSPNFDPGGCALSSDNALWLKGVNRDGEVVLCHALRLYSVRQTLKDELESLEFYFDEPAVARRAGVKVEVEAPIASRMTGRVAYSGALWVRSDFRGVGLARSIPPLSRAIALTQWYPAYHTCVLTQSTEEKGMAGVYGYQHCEYALWYTNLPGFAPFLKSALCWMETAEIEAEVVKEASRLQQGVRIGLERERRHETRLAS